MRFLSLALFILFNIYLIESSDRTDGDDKISAVSEPSEYETGKNVTTDGAQEKSDDVEEVFYDEYEYSDDKPNSENSISAQGRTDGVGDNNTTTESDTAVDETGFPNEVFLTLRNITGDAATAFRAFTHKNDVVDLQASASDNLNVTLNDTFDAETAGINLRALRDAGHPPQILEEFQNPLYLPYKHAKIDTADLSDCALQGEWKPMGVAHGHLHQQITVAGDSSHQNQADILQSVGSYAIPNKLIPHWEQSYESGSEGDSALEIHNHKPGGQLSHGGGVGVSGGGFASGSGFGGGNGVSVQSAGSHGVVGVNSGLLGGHHHGFAAGGAYSDVSSGKFQRVKSPGMLAPPPLPPIIFGKKPGYWKSQKSKHKFAHDKRKRPAGYSATGNSYSGFGFSNHVIHGPAAGTNSHLSFGHQGSGGGYSSSGSFGGQSGILSAHSNHGSGGGYSSSGGFGGQSGILSAHSNHGSGGGYSSVGGFGSHSGILSAHSNHASGGGHSSGSIFGGQSGVLSAHSNHGSDEGFGGHSGSSVLSSSSSVHGVFGGGADQGTGGFGGHSAALVLSGQSSHGGGGDLEGGSVAEHLIAGPSVLSHGGDGAGNDEGYSGSLNQGAEGDAGVIVGHSVSGPATHLGLLSGGEGIAGEGYITLGTPSLAGHITHEGGGGRGGGGGGDHLLPEAAFLSTHVSHGSGGSSFPDSTYSSSHINQGVGVGGGAGGIGGGGGVSLSNGGYLQSHISQDFGVHGQKLTDDSSSSSTFTCGKNHDHNTNYHTATFQVADHDHPSSVDVLQYQGDAAVLIKSSNVPFNDQLLPERKHYSSWNEKDDAEASNSDARNEIQAASLTSSQDEQETGQTEAETLKGEEGEEEEPERHSYYREITKVTKIPANSVGSVQYTFSKYETKPQTFTQESEADHEEPDTEAPQIIKELEQLSNKFQLDLENPQKHFDVPQSQDITYSFPFHGAEEQDDGGRFHFGGGEAEGLKNDGGEIITEFPYQIQHVNINQNVGNRFPVGGGHLAHHPFVAKKPVIKHHHLVRPGGVIKPQFYQKTSGHPKQPVIIVRKNKPKVVGKKKQNYEVVEHGGERHRPVGEIFPPQKFPKQFHLPKPNFAVDRPKQGWRPGSSENIFHYDFSSSQGKKIKKFKTKNKKILTPILIRRPVSEKIPPPVIRVVEVAG